MPQHARILVHTATWCFWSGVLGQAGLPLPSVPLLLAAGALGECTGSIFGLALLLCTLAAVSADTYLVSARQKERHQDSALAMQDFAWSRIPVCGASKGLFENRARNHCAGQFLPGLNTVATPLAGIFT